jgi:hypothetical protein
MRHHRILAAAAMALILCATAQAQTASAVPPENALKLSDIVAKIEQRDQFRYVSEIEWDEEGFYDITYFTSDKAKVEIKIDPVTGQPK